MGANILILRGIGFEMYPENGLGHSLGTNSGSMLAVGRQIGRFGPVLLQLLGRVERAKGDIVRGKSSIVEMTKLPSQFYHVD
jgi:hypothetical protein